MQLKDIYTPDVAYCERATTALQAAKLMRTKHVGDLVVVDDADDACIPVGIVTDRDIVIQVLGAGRDPASVHVGELLNGPLVQARDSEDIFEAAARMFAHRVRRLPVTGPDQRLVGIVALDDLSRILVEQASALLHITTSRREQRTFR